METEEVLLSFQKQILNLSEAISNLSNALKHHQQMIERQEKNIETLHALNNVIFGIACSTDDTTREAFIAAFEQLKQSDNPYLDAIVQDYLGQLQPSSHSPPEKSRFRLYAVKTQATDD